MIKKAIKSTAKKPSAQVSRQARPLAKKAITRKKPTAKTVSGKTAPKKTVKTTAKTPAPSQKKPLFTSNSQKPALHRRPLLVYSK
jgi:hypothetical protein